MLNRRDFLRTTALAAAAGTIPGVRLAEASLASPQPYFGLNPLIESNPKAVFIKRTHVPHKMDEAAKLREGHMLAREIFVPMDTPGIPITHRIVLKPNFMSVEDRHRPAVENWGTGTDPQFYEGMVTGLKEVGLKKFHFIEADEYWLWNKRGYVDINQRLGVAMNEPDRRPRHFQEGWDMTWSTVPDPVIFKRIPHYAPVNEPDTFLLNMAKWKSHGMCMTLSVKNEQGLVVNPFVEFCAGFRMVTGAPDFMKAGHQSQGRAFTQEALRQPRKDELRPLSKRGRTESDAPGDLGAQDMRSHECDEDRPCHDRRHLFAGWRRLQRGPGLPYQHGDVQ